LRDGWPMFSDAVVDYYGRKKLAYEYIRRVQADVCAICCEPVEGRHELVVVNDALQPADGHLTVTDMDTEQVLLATDYHIEANWKTTAGHIPQSPRPAMYMLQWSTADGKQHLNHYLAGPRPFSLQNYRRWLEVLRAMQSCDGDMAVITRKGEPGFRR
jgi:beta-mannosidase